MKKSIQYIKSTLFLIAVLTIMFIAIYNIAFATEETSLNIAENTNETVTNAVKGTRIIRTFSHKGARGGIGSGGDSIEDIEEIQRNLNSGAVTGQKMLSDYASIFCIKHYQELPDYIDYLDRIAKEDIDVSQYITLNYDLNSATINPKKFSDFREHGTRITRTTKSNAQWRYQKTDMKNISTSYDSYTTNLVVYAATFSIKRDYVSREFGYREEIAQQAIWNPFEYNDESIRLDGISLYKAGKCLDAYEAEVRTHGASPTAKAEEQAGTILLGDKPSNYQYKIGPFKMSDYAYLYSADAANYSGYSKDANGNVYHDGLMGGITSGKIILNNGTEFSIDGSSCKIEYYSYGAKNRSGQYWGAPSNYNFPWPNSTFYIVVNKNLCGDATTLSKVQFTYQSTRAEGSGWILESKYVETTWNMVDDKTASGVTYYCPMKWGTHNCTGYSNKSYSGECSECCDANKIYCEYGHTKNDTSGKYCKFTEIDIGDGYYSDDNSNEILTGKLVDNPIKRKVHTCEIKYCKDGNGNLHEDGKHGTHNVTYRSKQYSYYKVDNKDVWVKSEDWRTNGWTCVESFNWEASLSVQYGQPLLAVKSANVYVEETDFSVDVNIRLTTNVTIDKYITKVEHVGENGIIYGENEDRKDKDIRWKNENSVKVERGDRITWKIVLTNHQNAEVKVKIRDILPNNYEYTINPSINDWLVIPASGTKEIIVTTDVEDLTGIHENTALILTRNIGKSENDSVDYPKTTDQNGPVVNIAELEGGKIEDSDYFTIKEYNVSVDKNIVEVKHIGNDQIVYNGDSRKNIDEDSKKTNPVYVEYGDKITYNIDIYNTTTPYEANRNDSPYWDPDKVYVSIIDTLPKKYSNLKVTVSNGTGQIGYGGSSNNITEILSYKIADIEVPKNGKVTVTVSLVVEEHDKTKLEENKVEIIGNIKNINKKEAKNNSGRAVTSDYYHLNDYNISINKYIQYYNHKMTDSNNTNKFTDETVKFTDRSKMTEQEKADKPLAVEKTETIRYAVRLDNNSVLENKELPSGIKSATSVIPADITDVFDYGLKYKSSYARVYKTDGKDKYGKLGVSVTTLPNNTYKFTLENNNLKRNTIIIEPGEYVIYYITAEVVETNMYLYKLSNMAIITTLTNINNTDDLSRIVKNDDYNENISTTQTSRDYVKLKDLVIAGRVWLDTDKDGYIGKNASGELNSYVDYEANSSSKIPEPSGNSEFAMKGIKVNLYSRSGDTSTLVRTTKTDENGLFTFGKKDDGSLYDGVYSYDKAVVRESEQRIPKATNKDENLNYTTSSEYIEYYIEYEYDGLVFKSTEVYSGTNNLKNDGALVSGEKYKIDSNAKELKKYREEFNLKYEVIGYNKAYNNDLSNVENLEYEKVDHNSYLKSDKDRVMIARSFVIDIQSDKLINDYLMAMNNCTGTHWKECTNHWKNWKGLIDSEFFNESLYSNTIEGRKQAQAYLRSLYNYVIENLSADDDKQVTKYLWMFKPAVEIEKPETEYLKYINLGLEERENVDISVVQDVYEVRNIVNGEEMTYFYNQNKYALDGSNVDHPSNGTSEDYESQFYMTRNKAKANQDNAALSYYNFKYYQEDYEYKVDKYNIETVRNYKTKDSELNSEITFRIIVTNNKIENDEPYKDSKDIPVYTGINEVIEYFDENFMNIQYNEDGTVKTINVKTKDENGYLIDTPLKIADAYFVLPNKEKIPAIISSDGYNTSNDIKVLAKDSLYNENRTIDGHNTVYIRPDVDGVNKVILAEGENVDILIKFTVDKKNRNSDIARDRNLKEGLKTAIAEIGAYSTYYKNDDGSFYVAGLVDKDSNPGNFGETYNGIGFDKIKSRQEKDPYFKFYEDDTYKTGINVYVSRPTNRFIEGQVWDDARSEQAKTTDGGDTVDGIQYIGDGKNGDVITSKEANSKAQKNKVLKNADNTLKEKKDFTVNDVGVKLVEFVRIPVYDASGKLVEERTYEETIQASDDSIVEMRTGDRSVSGITEDGKYFLKGFLPGEYIVRFTYGDYDNLATDNVAIFNGQDYKSTTYQAGLSEYAEDVYKIKDEAVGTVERNLATIKKVRKILETEGLSDAKDDEIRRLETISYSETLNNNKTLLLRGVNSTDKNIQANKTSMNADTVDFVVTTETMNLEETVDRKITNTKFKYNETIEKFGRSKRQDIKNIDFGLQYRPEQQVSLNKYVKNLTVTTSDRSTGKAEPLVDARFNEYYGIVVDTDLETGVTTYLGYKIDGNTYETIRIPESYRTKASDETNEQYTYSLKKYVDKFIIDNNLVESDLNATLDNCKKNQDGTYQVVIAGTELDTENSIGLANLQYVQNDRDSHDKDSNQGFVYLNIDNEIMQGAEIKIKYLFTGSNLSEVDRVNKNLSVLRLKDNAEVSEYTNSIVDDSVVYSGALTAKNALFNEYYRYENDVTDTLEQDVIYRVKSKTLGDTKADYYGRYLGSVYYTGKVSNNDIIAELKIDKILDYVDNNLVFKQDENNSNSIDHFWMTTTASELALGGYINPDLLKDSLLLDSDGVAYNTTERSNLALLQDIRTSDSQGENDIANADITKFLSPRDSKPENSYGKVNIITSKIVSSEDETENMTYENVGEIVEYSSVTGRVTSLRTTLGNVDLSKPSKNPPNSPEFEQGQDPDNPDPSKQVTKESDTATVEKITLTPPTGMRRADRIIKETARKVGYAGIVVVIIALVIFGIFTGNKIYRNRRIK